MQAIKQYTEVIDGSIHINLPKNFTAKRVELIILSADDDDADSSDFQRFLLDSPEMTDEEYQTIKEKRRQPPTSIEGKSKITGDLIEPCIGIEDFECLK
ncbi:hypothetical protein [Crenothrix sp.]|uniref:hypothetical protein n=1 Tax=Crenothrix sp. TaxID=3100433 RepID=UPI00374CA705